MKQLFDDLAALTAENKELRAKLEILEGKVMETENNTLGLKLVFPVHHRITGGVDDIMLHNSFNKVLDVAKKQGWLSGNIIIKIQRI